MGGGRLGRKRRNERKDGRWAGVRREEGGEGRGRRKCLEDMWPACRSLPFRGLYYMTEDSHCVFRV